MQESDQVNKSHCSYKSLGVNKEQSAPWSHHDIVQEEVRQRKEISLVVTLSLKIKGITFRWKVSQIWRHVHVVILWLRIGRFRRWRNCRGIDWRRSADGIIWVTVWILQSRRVSRQRRCGTSWQRDSISWRRCRCRCRRGSGISRGINRILWSRKPRARRVSDGISQLRVSISRSIGNISSIEIGIVGGVHIVLGWPEMIMAVHIYKS